MNHPARPDHNFDLEVAPTPNEKNRAALTHALSIFFPLWVPAIIYAVHRDSSRFVRAHALQAIYEGIVWKAILLFAMLASLGFTIYRAVYHIQTRGENFSWEEVAIRVVISVVVIATLFLINTAQSMIQVYQARAGKWPKQRRWLRGLSAAKPKA